MYCRSFEEFNAMADAAALNVEKASGVETVTRDAADQLKINDLATAVMYLRRYLQKNNLALPYRIELQYTDPGNAYAFDRTVQQQTPTGSVVAIEHLGDGQFEICGIKMEAIVPF